jgi:hypothetical protein
MKCRSGTIDESAGLTPPTSPSNGLRLVSNRGPVQNWDSFDRVQRRPRDRLAPLASWEPKRRPPKS